MDEQIDLQERVTALLGRNVPPGSEACSSDAESLVYADEAEAFFDRAERLPRGADQTAVQQQAHDAMRLQASWSLQAEQEADAGL